MVAQNVVVMEEAGADCLAELKRVVSRVVEEWWTRMGEKLAQDRRLHSLIDADEAARLLGIPKSTLHELAMRGELPHYRYGKHYRFHPEELLAIGKERSSRRMVRA